MPRYLVAGPKYPYQEFGPCYPDTGGPVSTERHYVLVDAPTSQAARWAALRYCRIHDKRDGDWAHWNSPGHPLAGVKAERVDPDEYTVEEWGPDWYVDATIDEGTSDE